MTSLLTPMALDSIGTPTLWTVTIGLVLVLIALDFLLTRRPHEVSLREALGWSAFYVALPLAFGGWVWWALRLRPRRGVPHRLPGREVALASTTSSSSCCCSRPSPCPGRSSSGSCCTGSSARWCCAEPSSRSARPPSRRSTGVFLVFGLVLLVTGVKILRDAIRGPTHEVDVSSMRVVRLAAG